MVEHDIRQGSKPLIAGLCIQLFDQGMIDIDFQDGFRFRHGLTAGLQHSHQLGAQRIGTRNHSGRRVDLRLAEGNFLDPVGQDFLHLLQKRLVGFLVFFGSELARFRQLEVSARGIDHSLAFEFAQPVH